MAADTPNHRPGWLSSEAWVAAAAIKELAQTLHQPHWPAVQVAAAAALAWVAVAYSKHRAGLKGKLGPSRPVLTRFAGWLWTGLSRKFSGPSRPSTAQPSNPLPEHRP